MQVQYPNRRQYCRDALPENLFLESEENMFIHIERTWCRLIMILIVFSVKMKIVMQTLLPPLITISIKLIDTWNIKCSVQKMNRPKVRYCLLYIFKEYSDQNTKWFA